MISHENIRPLIQVSDRDVTFLRMQYIPEQREIPAAPVAAGRGLRSTDGFQRRRQLASAGDVLQVTAIVAVTSESAPAIVSNLNTKSTSLGVLLRESIASTTPNIGEITISSVSYDSLLTMQELFDPCSILVGDLVASF